MRMIHRRHVKTNKMIVNVNVRIHMCKASDLHSFDSSTAYAKSVIKGMRMIHRRHVKTNKMMVNVNVRIHMCKASHFASNQMFQAFRTAATTVSSQFSPRHNIVNTFLPLLSNLIKKQTCCGIAKTQTALPCALHNNVNEDSWPPVVLHRTKIIMTQIDL